MELRARFTALGALRSPPRYLGSSSAQRVCAASDSSVCVSEHEIWVSTYMWIECMPLSSAQLFSHAEKHGVFVSTHAEKRGSKHCEQHSVWYRKRRPGTAPAARPDREREHPAQCRLRMSRLLWNGVWRWSSRPQWRLHGAAGGLFLTRASCHSTPSGAPF